MNKQKLKLIDKTKEVIDYVISVRDKLVDVYLKENMNQQFIFL